MPSPSPCPPRELASSDASFSWLVWQLADSAFPTGGFAHSGGLEAAWQHGQVRDGTELESFVEASLRQVGHASLPFAAACHSEPGRLAEIDQLCDAFTTNHVANRASRLQGRALISAVGRTFGVITPNPPCCHFSPTFGALTCQLHLALPIVARLFMFTHVRSLLAAAVRLSIVGPMEAQALQFRLAPRSEEIAARCGAVALENVAQTAPLLDLWQGTHHRIYSRLFQS